MSLSVLDDKVKADVTMYPIASEEQYADGQIIFREGSWGDWVYVIKHGSVEISKTIGAKTYVLSVLESGEVLGELGYMPLPVGQTRFDRQGEAYT